MPWNICNLLHIAPDAKRLWQFDAKGPGRELRVPHAEKLPGKLVAKSWSSLWRPRLNVAWLPSESVFLRVVELPAADADETCSMVELQLEKLSPLPVTQIVWTLQVMGTHQSLAKADGSVESLQSVMVVIAARAVVEEFLGRLERDGFQADRLEVPMLDQLGAVTPQGDGVWFFPMTLGGQNAALVAWWFGGAWRSLGFVTLPPAGDRAGELRAQISLLAMAGEVEGWLTARPQWQLVADPVNASEWEQVLRAALNEPVQVIAPPPPPELARRSAQRAAAAKTRVNLLPGEFTTRYREQFFDRLWLHGLGYLGVLYAIGLAVYFGLATWREQQAQKVEAQLAALGGNYTNTVQTKAKLDVLQQRAQLKYAALDCWLLVAQDLPAAVTLKRWNFVDGRKLVLSGQVPAAETKSLTDFYDTLRKDKQPGHSQPFFNPNPATSDQLAFNQSGDTVNWNFSLELMNTEEQAQ